MKLVAMLRIKDQILTIRDCLDRLQDLVDEVVIVDNGSTDGTLEVYDEYDFIKAVKKTKGYHDGRDRIIALKLAKNRDPDLIVSLDADEVFEESLNRDYIESEFTDLDLDMLWFRMYNFWFDKGHFRVDGAWHKYTAFPQRCFFRNKDHAYFRNLKMHPGGVMGLTGTRKTSTYRLKHYGYIYKKQLNAKKKYYGKLTKEPRADKTMPMSQDGMIRLPFWSQTRLIEYYYWNVAQFVHHYVNILKMKFIK